MGALGRALIAEWGGGRKKSYGAVGWHAQIRKLTEAGGGAAAADKAGLDVTRSTLLKWLAQTQEPSAANQRKINEAYEVLGGFWDSANENRTYHIHGLIDSGDRSKTRILKVDGSRGSWSEIEEAYNDGADDDEIEELFIEHVINEDIGEPTDPWNFPGSSYSV